MEPGKRRPDEDLDEAGADSGEERYAASSCHGGANRVILLPADRSIKYCARGRSPPRPGASASGGRGSFYDLGRPGVGGSRHPATSAKVGAGRSASSSSDLSPADAKRAFPAVGIEQQRRPTPPSEMSLPSARRLQALNWHLCNLLSHADGCDGRRRGVSLNGRGRAEGNPAGRMPTAIRRRPVRRRATRRRSAIHLRCDEKRRARLLAVIELLAPRDLRRRSGPAVAVAVADVVRIIVRRRSRRVPGLCTVREAELNLQFLVR